MKIPKWFDQWRCPVCNKIIWRAILRREQCLHPQCVGMYLVGEFNKSSERMEKMYGVKQPRL